LKFQTMSRDEYKNKFKDETPRENILGDSMLDLQKGIDGKDETMLDKDLNESHVETESNISKLASLKHSNSRGVLKNSM